MANEFEMYSLDEERFLHADKNFYDQNPFSSAVKSLAAHPSASAWAKYGPHEWRNDPQSFVRSEIGMTARNIARHMQGGMTYVQAEKYILTTLNVSEVEKQIISAFQGYPHWYEYVAVTLRNTNAYKENGTPKRNMQKVIQEGIPTYATWLSERLQQQGDPTLFGIAHLFESSINKVNNRTRMRWESRRIIP